MRILSWAIAGVILGYTYPLLVSSIDWFLNLIFKR